MTGAIQLSNKKGANQMNALILRTCNADMTSYGGFVWPRSGYVSAPDWDATPECGGGLHGLLWGEGKGRLLQWDEDAVWLVAAVDTWVELEGKIKFPHADVVHCGGRKSATDYIIEHGAARERVIGAFAQGGDNATVSGGDYATVSGGNGATVIGGAHATVRGGEYATVSGGDYAMVSGGYGATVIGGCEATVIGGAHATVRGGDWATGKGGDFATVSGGDYATVSGGDYATVSGGDYAMVSGGNYARVSGGDGAWVSGGNGATVSGGDGAMVSGGDGAALVLEYCDGSLKVSIAYVGKAGILPDTFYRLNSRHEFEEVAK